MISVKEINKLRCEFVLISIIITLIGVSSNEQHLKSAKFCPDDRFDCGNGRCVPSPSICDGDNDCKDFKDEENCLHQADGTVRPKCYTGQFACLFDDLCLPARLRCDGNRDCLDASDEMDCGNACASNRFNCSNGKCIPSPWICDGDNDCGNRKDEEKCTPAPKCRTGQFDCGSGDTCIPAYWRCDGGPDCLDASDEKDCPPRADSTTTTTVGTKCWTDDKFACEFHDQCIPGYWRCDGEPDCFDSSDERGCAPRAVGTGRPKCLIIQFACESRDLCIPKDWRCDGNNDCSDLSDEKDCAPRAVSTTTTTVGPKCLADQFACEFHDQCIHSDWRCDGEVDCLDASDEKHCAPREDGTGRPKCLTKQFACESRDLCIPRDWRCDGETECPDKSDEKDC